ncbi:MAG TPA: hypothetical protein VFP05_12305 [Thermomicrobiales bacterium]|nr:hypothetical protein [Thermomicrobiales bacterium]
MDDRRFDSVSRLIAQGASRRAVMRGIFAGGLTVFTAGVLSAGAQPDKITMCKPAGAGYRLTEINAKQYEKRLAMGYVDPIDCGDGPTCEECEGTCLNPGDPCSSGADCCTERCLPGGTCGDLCYCHDLYDGSGQACRSGFGWSCPQESGCTSNADCGDGHYCIVNVDPVDCSSPTGICTSDEYDPCDS